MSVVETVKNALPSVSLPSVSLPELPVQEARKPLYAVLGAGDLAVEQARGQVKELQATLPTLPKAAQAKVADYQAKVTGYVASVPAQLQQLRGQVSTDSLKAKVSVKTMSLKTVVPVKTTATVKTKVGDLTGKAGALYSELAVRGEKLVTTIRKQPATQAAEKAARQTVRSAKATSTSAKKAVSATAAAVEAASQKIG
jgi:hypothetical protein